MGPKIPVLEHAGSERIAQRGKEKKGKVGESLNGSLEEEESYPRPDRWSGRRARSNSARGCRRVAAQRRQGEELQGRCWALGDGGTSVAPQAAPALGPASLCTWGGRWLAPKQGASQCTCRDPAASPFVRILDFRRSLGSQHVAQGGCRGRPCPSSLACSRRAVAETGWAVSLIFMGFSQPELAPAPFYLLSCTWLVYFGGPGSLNPGAEAGELGRQEAGVWG